MAQRARLGEEILGLYALYERQGAGELLAAMALATTQGAYGVAYLQALLAPPDPAAAVQTPPPRATDLPPSLLALADLPPGRGTPVVGAALAARPSPRLA